MRAVIFAVISACGWVALAATGQSPGTDPSSLSPIKWRNIGPVNTSGRIDDIAVGQAPGQPETIYVATASGGVFKSANAGISWQPIFDHADAMMSIGAIAVAASDPNVVWVGTGEANNRQSSSWGDGVYRSADAGRTWTHAGLADTRHIGRIVIDPANSNVVYVAAAGHLWGSNTERGVFKTSDGGATWRRTLYVDEHTGASDLAIDPQHPQTLYAATYQRERKSWGFNGGGPGSAIYKSTDGGEHWTKLTRGLPAGDKGRIGLAVFDSSLVYAIVEAALPAKRDDAPDKQGGGLFRSIDGGETWEPLSRLNPRPSYFSQIRVDPRDRSRLYQLGSNRGLFVSSDGGRTMIDTGVSGVHGEDHALWVDPADSNHLIVGGDGGVSISRDRGRTWDFRMNMPVGQFYEIDADMRVPFTVCGGLQDNGEWCVPSAVRDRSGIGARDAWNVGDGDGFYVKFDPTDPDVVYTESQNGGMARVNMTTLERQPIKPSGSSYRWNWDTPIVISSADPRVIYTGAHVLLRSPDRGTTWKAVSPDLTSGIDPDSLAIMGRPAPKDALSRNDGTSPLGSITSISESPLDPNVLYTGAEDGTVQVTRDGGRTWTNLTSRLTDVPRLTYVSAVLASKHFPGRVYVTLDGHYTDDYRPYVFVSDDFGGSWRSLAAGLPETSVHRLREHPSNPHFLLLAHERGVHMSVDDGRSWMALSHMTNLPTVRTDDILFHPRDHAIVAGTHGRSLWILDDAGPLELLASDAALRAATLAPLAPAREMLMHTPQAWFGQGTFFAPNPPFGATITYFLRNDAPESVAIEIREPSGRTVRRFDGPGGKGLNQVRWDLRAEPSGRTPPPFVPPGPYDVILRVPGVQAELRGTVTVEADPIGAASR